MGALTFNGPYDWGNIIVGTSETFNITYNTSGPGTISNLVITVETGSENTDVVINNYTVTITPQSDWISPDLIKIQNAQYPAYQGDISNQIVTNKISDITNNYLDTILYCFEFNIEPPVDRSGSVTATANYTLTVVTPADPTATPPIVGSTDITQETETQVYTFTERKNLDSAKAILEQLTDIGLSNQQNI